MANIVSTAKNANSGDAAHAADAAYTLDVGDAAYTGPRYHLAQLNVARLRAPIDSPLLADFVAGLHTINQLAEAAPGFVWRLIGDPEDPDATYTPAVFDADILVNLSVWEDADSLWDFVYRSGHLDYLRRRGQWFADLGERYQVLWWVPVGTEPTERDAADRLELLRKVGPGPDAFTFRQRYPAPAGTP